MVDDFGEMNNKTFAKHGDYDRIMAEISKIMGKEGTDVCRVTGFDLGDREIHMAEIKQRYIPNMALTSTRAMAQKRIPRRF